MTDLCTSYSNTYNFSNIIYLCKVALTNTI